jgi:hypothetical protein
MMYSFSFKNMWNGFLVARLFMFNPTGVENMKNFTLSFMA